MCASEGQMEISLFQYPTPFVHIGLVLLISAITLSNETWSYLSYK